MVKHSSTKMSGGYNSSMANVMEKDTEDSHTRLTSEIKQVKQYARAKSQQKHTRKLYRPQTGTVEGRKKAFGMLPHSRQTASGMELGVPAFEIPQRLNGEISSNAFLPPTGN